MNTALFEEMLCGWVTFKFEILWCC